MEQRVAIVTDSTASLPRELATQWGISVVNMQIQIGDEITNEVSVPTSRLVSAMYDGVPVRADAPVPDALYWAYQDAWFKGAEAIVSLHLSARFSPATQSALDAATHFRIPVHIVDSQSSGMTLGFAALAAARSAAGGGSPAEVCASAQKRARSSHVLIYVDSLDYLHRAGHIGKAAHLLGSTLSVKPILTVRNGEAEPIDRVFRSERAVGKLVDRAVRLAGERQVDVAVEHFAAQQESEELITALRHKLGGNGQFVHTPVSAAIGTNVGPGALAVTVSPR